MRFLWISKIFLTSSYMCITNSVSTTSYPFTTLPSATVFFFPQVPAPTFRNYVSVCDPLTINEVAYKSVDLGLFMEARTTNLPPLRKMMASLPSNYSEVSGTTWVPRLTVMKCLKAQSWEITAAAVSSWDAKAMAGPDGTPPALLSVSCFLQSSRDLSRNVLWALEKVMEMLYVTQ